MAALTNTQHQLFLSKVPSWAGLASTSPLQWRAHSDFIYVFKLTSVTASKSWEVHLGSVEFLLLLLGSLVLLALLLVASPAVIVAGTSSSATALVLWPEFGEAASDFLLIEIIVDIEARVIIVPVNFVAFDRVQLPGKIFRQLGNALLQLVVFFALAPRIVLQ